MSLTQNKNVTSNISEDFSEPASVRLELLKTMRNIGSLVLIGLFEDADEILFAKDDNIVKLRHIVNYLRIFSDPDMCTNYIIDCREEKVFLIVSSSIGKQIIPLIHQIDQLDSIYVYCSNKVEGSSWAQDYRKVHGVFVDIDLICEQLNKDTRQSSNNLIPMSSIPFSSVLTDDVNGDKVSFMYAELIRDLFLNMEHPYHAVREMIRFFSNQYRGNHHQMALLDEIDSDYYSNPSLDISQIDKSVRWYTRSPFIYDTLNKALRTQDIDMLQIMRFFITDIDKQLQRLYSAKTSAMTVYRGQAMSSEEFNKHRSNIGGFMSIHNFLSTSKNPQVAKSFVVANKDRPNMEAILFKIELDAKAGEICPFADIEHLSCFPEENEVLISIGSVFQIHSVEIDNDGIWNMHLKLTAKVDQELETLRRCIWKKIRSDDGRFSMAKLMRLMGKFEKAEMFIDLIMEESTFCDDLQNLALVVNEIGLIHEERGDLTTANLYYQKFIEMKQKRHLLLSYNMHVAATPDVTCKNIISHIQCIENENSQVFETHERFFKAKSKETNLEQKILIACSRAMSQIYEKRENEIEALFYAERVNREAANDDNEDVLEVSTAFQLNQRTIASYCHRIGVSFDAQGRYADAVMMYEKTLICLVDRCKDKEIVLANIGHAYEKQGNYLASLDMYERLFSIQSERFYDEHPFLAETYAWIGRSTACQHRYKDALMFLNLALDIDSISMTINHPWIKQRQAEIDVIRAKDLLNSSS